MQLRHYQEKAIADLYHHLENFSTNPCLVLPTGSGKTPVIAQICKDAVGWGERVIVLAHVKELLEQSVHKLGIIAPELSVGVYSAGLKSRDTDEPVLVAGIQSIWDKADQIGPRSLIIIDECHLISPNEDSRYQCFISLMGVLNPGIRVVGLTATPYRLDSGPLCGPGNILNVVCHETYIGELIDQGFLSKLSCKVVASDAVADTTGVAKRGGEFVESELAHAVNQPTVVRAACLEILKKAEGRKSILVFCTGIDHALAVVDTLNSHGDRAGVVALCTGNTPSPERALMLKQFKNGEIRIMVNVMVLTTGFDAPNVDCVCILRPTMSPGLYYQMIGRGFRITEGKSGCLVLDFGENIYRHGPIDCIVPIAKGGGSASAEEPRAQIPEGIRAKACPECGELVPIAAKDCDCGAVFPEKGPTHKAKHDENGQLLGRGNQPPRTDPVKDIYFSVHTKKGANDTHPKTMRVQYYTAMNSSVSEWVCFEHSGFAFEKAKNWWALRSHLPCPRSAKEAVRIANLEQLAPTVSVATQIKDGSRWPDLVSVSLGPIPALFDATPDEYRADDDAPLSLPFGAESEASCLWPENALNLPF